jgi:PAS domain S-box-containing protein
MTNYFNYNDKAKDELIKKLQKLQQEFDSLKTSYEKEITERKKVEEALKFTRLILDNAADTMTCIDHDGHFIDVNDAFCRSVGFSREEIFSMTVHDIDPNYPAEIWPEFWEKLKQAGSLTFESVHRTKEEKLIPVEINVNFFEYEGKEYHSGFARDITERKLAEDALRQSEMKLKTLFEVLPIGISILDAERNVVFVNPALEKILNITKDGLIRGDYKSRKYLRPDGTQMPEEEFASVRAIREQRVVHDVETGVQMENGHVIRTNVNAAPVAFPDWKVVIITTDITERKRIEEMLQKSELKYRNLIEQAPDIVFVVDVEGNLLHVNQTGKKMLGYSEDELYKMKTVDTYQANEMKVGLRRLKEFRAMRAGEAMYFERLMRRKDGSSFPVEINVGALEDGTAHAIIRDITERKQAEEVLHLEKENFRHSLDDSPLGVRIATIEGNTIYANKTLLDFYGYDSLEELQKTPLKDRYTPESYVQALERKHQRERGDLSATDYEISIVRKNGEIRHLQVFRKEVLWDGVRQFQVICNDITERKQAEEEIRKSKKLLEDLHKHLNEILENERALISREIHDQIGQSLTALKLDLNWMHKYINTNPEAAAKLKGMIELVSNTIKDVQRISSDLRPGILDDLGLVSAIEWYCDEFEKRTGIKCILKLDTSDYGDSQINLSFFRILQEALTNVIRHANASSVTIKLHQTQKGTTLTIQDNGIGIKAEMVESTKALGLIGMRERVRQFNGKIDISSKKGDGAKLTIFIPSLKK